MPEAKQVQKQKPKKVDYADAVQDVLDTLSKWSTEPKKQRRILSKTYHILTLKIKSEKK